MTQQNSNQPVIGKKVLFLGGTKDAERILVERPYPFLVAAPNGDLIPFESYEEAKKGVGDCYVLQIISNTEILLFWYMYHTINNPFQLLLDGYKTRTLDS